MLKSFTGVFAATLVALATTAPASAKLAADNDVVTGGWDAQAHSYIVNNINYPFSAEKNGIEGQLKVRVKIAANRAVTGVELLETSGNRSLDKATVSGFFNLSNFPALPAGVSSKTLVVPVTYKIAQ
jgi:protein TonB